MKSIADKLPNKAEELGASVFKASPKVKPEAESKAELDLPTLKKELEDKLAKTDEKHNKENEKQAKENEKQTKEIQALKDTLTS